MGDILILDIGEVKKIDEIPFCTSKEPLMDDKIQEIHKDEASTTLFNNPTKQIKSISEFTP